MPPEFQEWIPWLAHKDTLAPIALAGCQEGGAGLCFYPFADFSPELATIRWAAQHGVPVQAFDAPVSERDYGFVRQTAKPRGLLDRLLQRTQASDVGQLWDALVESPAVASTAEQTRRAALMFGWALRWNDGGPALDDYRREAHMRSCIEAAAGQRCAAVIGSYHAAALLPEPKLWDMPDGCDDVQNTAESTEPAKQIATALIPYSFEQLDERSGYPAGIRNPMWHQQMFAATSAECMDHALVDLVVAVCRELRQARHPMNAADAQEVVRISRDLARVRNFATPGRQELIEALQLCLTQGQLYGAGRSVAAAMQTVLVGQRSGELPEDLPRCGLAPHIEDVFQRLRLPGAETLGQDKRMRLDPLRSALDRARYVVFQQLQVCQIPYATPEADGSAGDRESLTSVWTVKWENSTAAMIALSSARGVTLRQAASGAVQKQWMIEESEWGADQLQAVHVAAECGFGDVVLRGLNWINGAFASSASLAELTVALSFADRVVMGHYPGLPSVDDQYLSEFCEPFLLPDSLSTVGLLQSAIARIDGIVGSDDEADVAALLDLLLWFQQQDDDAATIEAGRLVWSLRQLLNDGSALMQGAGLGALFLLNQVSMQDFQQHTGSWLDAAVDADSRRNLQLRLRGAIRIAQPRLHAEVACLDGLDDRIDAYDDGDFMHRLPALRKGFAVISAAGCRALLRMLLDRYPDDSARSAPQASVAAEQQQSWFEADEVARQVVAELMPNLQLVESLEGSAVEPERQRRAADVNRELSQADRWRLILGTSSGSMSRAARRAAGALDELYGKSGSGEGSRGDFGGACGGDEAPYPNVREWAEDLEDLFGDVVREEMLAEAVEQGRAAALTMLDENSLRPSIELLEQVLSMKGALPESQMEHLRRVARRITEQLAKELATRMGPALTGLSTPRPTRRPTRKLDLRRTIMANLHTASKNEAGKTQLVPEDFFFKTPARRSMDWHIIYVVDVSGSMEPSVIYSALTAAIFSGLPALSVSFLAFSTSVIDFTGAVEDPLQMLMEVQVGGGTFIAKGLQAAREKLKVPSRTIVLLITDFVEGGSVGQLLAEVRALTDTGARVLGLAALSDDGKPRYHTGIAGQVAACGMPVAALSPGELARWVGEQVK